MHNVCMWWRMSHSYYGSAGVASAWSLLKCPTSGATFNSTCQPLPWTFGLLLVALWGGKMPGSMKSDCTQYLSGLVQAHEQLIHKVRLVEPP